MKRAVATYVYAAFLAATACAALVVGVHDAATASGGLGVTVASLLLVVVGVAEGIAAVVLLRLATRTRSSAELTSSNVGYIANNGEPDESLKTATKAAMTISHMANRVANQAVKAHEAIPELLPDEPGMQVADEGAPETGAVVAPTPGEPVPVEDLDGDGPVTGAEQQPEGDGQDPAEDEATTAPPDEATTAPPTEQD